MNQDLVKRLAEKAGFTAGAERYATPDYQTVEPELMERFAELIVRECALLVDRMDSGRKEYFQRLDGSKVVTGDVLKHYFGIKE